MNKFSKIIFLFQKKKILCYVRSRSKKEHALVVSSSSKLLISSKLQITMMEPDELYTLRAQYWLGHYQMALDEAKGIMRRPMSVELKQEREEFVARCHISMKEYDKVIAGDCKFFTELDGK